MFRIAKMRLLAGSIISLALALGGAAAMAAEADVAGIVNGYLKSKHGYKPGDLISQGDWDAIALKLVAAGFEVRDPAAIRGAILPDNDFLVEQSRNKKRAQFFRDSGRYALGYDRLEHLSRLSDGQRIITRLADGRDGYKMVEYLATSSGGKNMGTMLSVDPGGKDFNKPTGHIYTADQLIARLTGKAPAKSRESRGRTRGY